MKFSKLFFIISFILLIALISCTFFPLNKTSDNSIQRRRHSPDLYSDMKSWEGKNIDDLLKVMRIVYSYDTFYTGEKIYEWHESHSSTEPDCSETEAFGGKDYRLPDVNYDCPLEVINCIVNAEVDKNGIITRVTSSDLIDCTTIYNVIHFPKAPELIEEQDKK